MKKTILILALLFCKNVFAQELTLNGIIKISIEEGTIDCDFTLSNIPDIEDYEILINSGFNINVIRADQFDLNYAYQKKYDSKISNESFLYSIHNEDGKLLQKKLRFIYTGKFPVKSDTTFLKRSKDWKGNIAFNGNSLRMDGKQSNWYPVLYDIKADRHYETLTYDLKVVCEDCKTLYINGNPPVNSTEHNFKSNIETELLLFVGDYEFVEFEGVYYLNPDIDKSEIIEFSAIVEKFKNYYADKLNIQYKGNLIFLQSTPTFSRNSGFLFVSYPTIANVGMGKYGLKSVVTYDYTKPLIAHELAHYYFGSGYRKFNSPIFGAIQEGFAEFMSYKATNAILGKEICQNKLENALNNIKNSKIDFLPISKIEIEQDFKNYYRSVYDYFPIVLLAIEQEIGEEKMWEWMKNLLTTKATFTDYDFLRNTLAKTINDSEKSKEIIEKYFIGDTSLDNAIKHLKNK